MRIVKYTISGFEAEELGIFIGQLSNMFQSQGRTDDLVRLKKILSNMFNSQEVFDLVGNNLVPVPVNKEGQDAPPAEAPPTTGEGND